MSARQPTTPDLIDGGEGIDELRFSWYGWGGLNIDFSKVLNFELINFTDGNGGGLRAVLSDVTAVAGMTLVVRAGTGGHGINVDGSAETDAYLQITGVDSYSPNDTLTGGQLADTISGLGGHDVLSGQDGNDWLLGGAGDDTLTGGLGDDTLDGGDGLDVVMFEGNYADYVIAEVVGGLTVSSTEGDDVLRNTNRLIFSDQTVEVIIAGVYLSGTDAADLIEGGTGDDAIYGEGGNDTILGSEGSDLISGGMGDDSLYAASGDDTVDAGDGNDLIVGGDGAGDDLYMGGTGVDTVRYTSATAGIKVNLSAARDQARSISADLAGIGVDQLSDIENIIAGYYDDILTGNAADNVFAGMTGNDVIDGGLGIDTVEIAILFADVTNVALANGSGGVVVTSAQGRDSLINVERVQFLDVAYTPSELLQLLKISEEFSIVRNGVSSGASPTLFTGSASLNLHYQMIDTTPNAIVFGSAFNDFIVMQGGGNKAVNGGLGNDVIDGGIGSTFVSGGGGSNTFFLDGRASGVSWSTITDFELGQDKATIWGWEAGVSRVQAIEANGGASSYTGLTLHFENLLPDGSASTARNASLNSITFSNMSLSDFGATSLDQLNQQMTEGLNSHFTVGQTSDAYGEHGYLFIS
jgi:Ca2+-binding RTX toxin-like protein